MSKLEQVLDSTAKKGKTSTNNNNKQKWREIEQLKEKFELKKELKMCEYSLEYMLDDF